MVEAPELNCVSLEWQDDIAVLSLNRPEALNAMSLDLLNDINLALDEVAVRKPHARALVITGEGKAFCAGGDISVHSNKPDDAPPIDLADVMRRYFNPLLLRLTNLPLPVVIAVNGAAAGAGLPFSLFGDVVVAGESARFSSGFSQIALMPDMGLTWLLPRLIGRARAHRILLLDERVTGEQAAEWGMIHECVPDKDLREQALKIARKLARGSITALVATRKATLFSMGDSLSASIEKEADYQRALGFAGDFQEGIAAFFEKRRPKFTDS